jgi:NAD(P)H-quinone oxidoreductase subunit 5
MTVGMGLALHAPILLYQWGLLPQLSDLNLNIAAALAVTTLVGAGAASLIYLNDSIAKPIQLKPKAVQDFFAYDLYTEKLYRITIISLVGIVSQIVYWCDRYLVDGVINFFGLATIFSGESLRYNTSGQTQFYFLSILLGVFLFVGIICFPWFSNYLL